MSQPVILVCALADAAHVVPGSIFTHECAKCGRALMMAPSGQRVLHKYPQAMVICGDCFYAMPDSSDYTLQPAASPDEIRDEVRRSQPNLRKRRN